ncbi:MAG: hypothetical protein L0H08_26965 [Comamonas sp.]|nr:hypothetical protein [Comamonas sp.]
MDTARRAHLMLDWGLQGKRAHLIDEHSAIQTKRHQRLIGLRLELAHRGHLLGTHCLDAAVKTFGNLYKAVDFHPEVTH